MVVAVAAPILALAVALSLYAMRDAVIFFYGPTQARTEHVPPGRLVRIGGLVQPGTVVQSGDGMVRFTITDNVNTVPTQYRGQLPDLFREGQGVVAQGEFDGAGLFEAHEVLAKHDEKYMPKEVVDALKKSGQWRGGPDGQPVAPAAAPSKTGA